MQNNITNINAEIELLEKTKVSLSQQITNLNKEISNKESELNKTAKQRDEITKYKDTLGFLKGKERKQIENVQIPEYNSKISSFDSEINSSKSKVSNIKNKLYNKLYNLETKMEKLINDKRKLLKEEELINKIKKGETKEIHNLFNNCLNRKDFENGIVYLRILSEHTNQSAAKRQLALWYFNGIGVEKSDKIGIDWLKKAADEKNDEDQKDAQYALAEAYYLGDYGLQTDHKEAFRLYEIAAKQNHEDAKFKLGFMYGHDEGNV